jgi:hypothetical protein
VPSTAFVAKPVPAKQIRLMCALPHGMKRADQTKPFDLMLTIGSFAIAFFAVIGCVCWACLNDSDQT